MRCADCGALNPASADWCGQCLKRFTAPPPPAEVVAAEPTRVTQAAEGPAEVAVATRAEVSASPASTPKPEAAPPPAHMVGETRGAFKVGERGVMWTCASCETENAMEEPRCRVCGTELTNMLRPVEEKGPERDPQRTALISLVMPGAGHAYIGHWPQAISRMILQSWVLAAALIGRAQSSLMLFVVFGLASLGLWALAAHDSYQEASGRSDAVILEGRRFLWVVLGLLGILIMAVGVSAMRAPGALN